MNAIVAQSAANGFIELALRSLESAASQRVYGQTYRAWAEYCESAGLSPYDLSPAPVLGFIGSKDTTKTTRQRQLSALRKLAQMMFITQPSEEIRRMYEALKVIKAPASPHMGKERAKRALAPSQADKLLRHWTGNTPQDKRNAALIAVLLLSGVRRSEAAALRWEDVDFENGVLTIRHGKGDKERSVPLAGDYAVAALRSWRMVQPIGYDYVFTTVERGGGVAGDTSISGTDVYRIVKATEQATGVEFRPHDARRTFITEALATGTPIQTVQGIAGHARGDTTLNYAEAVDARRARKELKLRYG